MQAPRRDHIRLPVELLDPVQRLESAARPGNVDDHHQGRSGRRLEVWRDGVQQSEDVSVEPAQFAEQPRPWPEVRRLRLEARRHGLAGRALACEQAAQLVHTRTIRFHQMVHDLLDRPLTGNRDRKSTRLNSSHGYISYAVFCLKKKKKKRITRQTAYTRRQ